VVLQVVYNNLRNTSKLTGVVFVLSHLQMAEGETTKVCLVYYGANNRKISWPSASSSDLKSIIKEFKTVFHDLVPADLKGQIVFQKWDKDFDEWIDIGPHDSVENKSKLKAFKKDDKSDESEVKHDDSTVKELGDTTLPFSKQRTIGKDGELGPCISPNTDAKKSNNIAVPVNVDNLREESKLYGRKDTNDKSLSEWHKKMNEAAFLLCMDNPSLALRRGDLLQKAREKVDSDGFGYKKGKSRSKRFGEASAEINKIKRPKLESEERRDLIEETKISINEQSEKLAMLEREKYKLVNMNQFGAASVILDRISSARKEKGQLSKKLAALEQKEAKSMKRKLSLEEGKKTMKKAVPTNVDNKSCLLNKYLRPRTEQKKNESTVTEQKQNESTVTEQKQNESTVTEQKKNESTVTEQKAKDHFL